MSQLFQDFPVGSFNAILMDPPWDFDVFSGWGNRHPQRHYSCLSQDNLKTLPVSSIAPDNCALFLWTTCPHLPDAIELGCSFGFVYKTVGFSWMKTNKNGSPSMGLGSWTRSNVEICLLFVRGKVVRRSAAVMQAILEPRREHSRKPECVHGRIEQLVDGPYVELFARESVPGWTTWGNEVEKFISEGDA